MYRGFYFWIFFTGFLLLITCRQVISQNLFEIQSLEFNTREYDEFAPVLYGNGLVFNTYRTRHVYKSEVDLQEKVINDLYFISKKEDGKWSELQYFSNELNSKFHEGKCTFTKDGNTIFFTRVQDSTGYIYRAVKSGGEWGNQVYISLNSDKYWIKDPCLSTDGKKMFFASKAPGGYGGYDLYVSVFERGDWGFPRNLGPLVNTKGDETGPFFHGNGKLYFSSNKLPGAVRDDIFYTREVNGKWITPKRLPDNINSNRDDRYYISDPGDTTGYFCSNRNRSFDIFSFRSLWPKFDNCKPLEKNSYKYLFFQEGSVDTDTTTWLYEWDFGDGTKIKGKKPEAEHLFASTGQYIIQLNVIDTLTGEILLNEDTYPFDVMDIEQAYISSPDTVVAELSVKFDASATNLPEFKKIDFYYWDFGDGEREVGLSPEHNFLVPGNYTVRLCVQSSADENGSFKQSCVSKDIVVIKTP